jgi:hypothetical protein
VKYVPYTSHPCSVAIRARLRPRVPLAPVISSRRITFLRWQSTIPSAVISIQLGQLPCTGGAIVRLHAAPGTAVPTTSSRNPLLIPRTRQRYRFSAKAKFLASSCKIAWHSSRLSQHRSSLHGTGYTAFGPSILSNLSSQSGSDGSLRVGLPSPMRWRRIWASRSCSAPIQAN